MSPSTAMAHWHTIRTAYFVVLIFVVLIFDYSENESLPPYQLLLFHPTL